MNQSQLTREVRQANLCTDGDLIQQIRARGPQGWRSEAAIVLLDRYAGTLTHLVGWWGKRNRLRHSSEQARFDVLSSFC